MNNNFELALPENKKYEYEIIRKYGKENKDYSLSEKQLFQKEGQNDYIYEYIFPLLPASVIADREGLVVKVGDIIVGTVKSGSVSRVRNLLASDNTNSAVSIKGGRYKIFAVNDDDDIYLANGVHPLWTKLVIGENTPVSAKSNYNSTSKSNDKSKQALGYIAFILMIIAILILIFTK